MDWRPRRNKAQRQLRDREAKLQSRMLSAEKRVQAGLLSKNEIVALQQEIADEQQSLQAFSQTLTTGLIEEEKVLQEKIVQDIKKCVEEYNTPKKYDIILNYTFGTTVWYGDKSIDLTNDILAILNDKRKENE